MRCATSVSSIKGRARLKRYLQPSANVHEGATATQGPTKCEGRKPVKRNAPAARTPQSAPAVPAMVKARSRAVNGGHFRRKMALNSARSRSLIVRTSFFNLADFALEGFDIVPSLGPGVRQRSRREPRPRRPVLGNAVCATL